MPIIKKFKQGVYEHSNLFKIKNPTVTVGDDEVKEITPFRGVIQTQGDIISSEDFNEMQKNQIYFVETSYSEDYGSGVDAYIINNLQSEQEIFYGLKLKFIIPKTNLFDNPIIVFKNNTYPLKLNINENIKAQTLKKDNIINIIYMEQYFLVELVTEASETTSGIGKIYSEAEADTDIDRIADIVKSGTGDDRQVLGDGPDGAVYDESAWDKLMKILNHTKILTIKNVVKLIRKI
ncbi:MAG: hypothetical protein Q4D53_03930, partial [Leptotrichiaceae bacterium]|nr:hypothetical protein [Leptotrichiaceae bacterium]